MKSRLRVLKMLLPHKLSHGRSAPQDTPNASLLPAVGERCVRSGRAAGPYVIATLKVWQPSGCAGGRYYTTEKTIITCVSL